MSNFYATYPPSSGSSSANLSVGTNGTTAPTSSTEVGGINPSGNLQPLQTDASGNLLVNLQSPVNVSENLAQVAGNTVNTGVGTGGSGTQRVALDSASTIANTSFQATQSIPSALQTTATQGAPGIASNAWYTKITDGTNTAGVTAASTAATATQPAEVVALSPNSPLPAGTNSIGSISNISGTVSLPTGASTSALQTTGNTTLASIQANQTNGTQTASLVAGTATIGSINNISGTVSLPTGAATSALQSNVQSAPGTSATTAITIQGSASGVAIPVSGTVTTSNSANGATGSAVPAQATQVAGSKSGTLQALALDSSGNLNVDLQTALPAGANNIGSITNITGTVSLPTGAATLAAQNAVIGSATGGTAATSSELTGGVYNTTLPTLTNGQQAGVQVDVNGRQIVVGAGTAGTASGGVVTVQGVSGGTVLPVNVTSQTLPSTPLVGQTTSTGTAVAIGSGALTQGVIIQALATNAGNVYIGASGVTTSTGFQLQPGQATSTAVSNLSGVYVIAATSGDGVCYIGS